MAATPTSSSSTPHSSSTPQPHFFSSASPHPASPSSSKPTKSSSNRPKPMNVFTNDGSFLERFQRSKKEEEEKKKIDDDAMRKRTFEDRFKKRGKRPAPDTLVSDEGDDSPSKKMRFEKDRDKDKDKPLTQYEKEVKSYAGRSLKDNGIGVRPLVK